MQASYHLPQSLIEVARKLYDSNLPYHNFNHGLDVVRRATTIIDRCEAEGVSINREKVLVGALFHDAGYRANHRGLGYSTKEAYAVHLTRETLRGLAYPGETIAGVSEVIEATERVAPQRTNEDRIIRAADIGNLADSYEVFIDANRRLKLETEQLDGHSLTWAEWKFSTMTVVSQFFRQDIRLTSYHDDADGRSVWHVRTLHNLMQFFQDPAFHD